MLLSGVALTCVVCVPFNRLLLRPALLCLPRAMSALLSLVTQLASIARVEHAAAVSGTFVPYVCVIHAVFFDAISVVCVCDARRSGYWHYCALCVHGARGCCYRGYWCRLRVRSTLLLGVSTALYGCTLHTIAAVVAPKCFLCGGLHDSGSEVECVIRAGQAPCCVWRRY